ncbi:hypothetical protein [Burkholderia gladioli]|uniref:hypothetical protein n=1 Tax=Burkholderia gladioli TaxID=28095 RepID=UPI000BBD0A60|nr:hypothetical protein [Burkholderia gladioli]ATF86873.1 hypothetical protein CO712_18735 [Burkholderia gladioli pv. gladioli]
MKIIIAVLICIVAAACASPRPRYTPRMPCPDLPELPASATRAELEQHDLTVVRMYGECRKARRVNPRVTEGAKQ